MPIYYEASGLKSAGAAQLKERHAKREGAPKSGYPSLSVRGKKPAGLGNRKTYK